jgi:hypothetical protein
LIALYRGKEQKRLSDLADMSAAIRVAVNGKETVFSKHHRTLKGK